jgi:hypothetical protein
MRISAAAYCDCHCKKHATLSTAVYIDIRMDLQGLYTGKEGLRPDLKLRSPLQFAQS